MFPARGRFSATVACFGYLFNRKFCGICDEPAPRRLRTGLQTLGAFFPIWHECIAARQSGNPRQLADLRKGLMAMQMAARSWKCLAENMFSNSQMEKSGTNLARLRAAAPPLMSAEQLIANLRSGLVFVTGPAGCGKSATLAALLNLINEVRTIQVITVEDPIEFLHPTTGRRLSKGNSIVVFPVFQRPSGLLCGYRPTSFFSAISGTAKPQISVWNRPSGLPEAKRPGTNPGVSKRHT